MPPIPFQIVGIVKIDREGPVSWCEHLFCASSGNDAWDTWQSNHATPNEETSIFADLPRLQVELSDLHTEMVAAL